MISGNAARDGDPHRGWFVGQFLPEGSPLKNPDIEVKWGIEPAGRTKASAGVNKVSKTLAILIKGTFIMNVDGKEIVLKEPGDYVYHEAGEVHTWQAVTDCVVLTVRWPSVADDQVRVSAD